MTDQTIKLKELREYLGLNTTEISTALGIRHTTWSAVERGDNGLSSPMKQLLAAKFRVSIEWLEGTSDHMFQVDDEPGSAHLVSDLIAHYLYINNISFRQASEDTGIEPYRIVEMVNNRKAHPDLIMRFKRAYPELRLELPTCEKCEETIKQLKDEVERYKKMLDKLMS